MEYMELPGTLLIPGLKNKKNCSEKMLAFYLKKLFSYSQNGTS